MGLLNGHRAVVTGGGSGIGAETCRRMAAEGAQVAVLDVNAENADAVAKEIDGLSYTVDVTDFDALSAAMLDAPSAWAACRSSTTTRAGARCRRSTTTTSRSGAASSSSTSPASSTASRPAHPLILKNGGGAIVSTASISGTRPAAGEAPYAAAKAAVVALTASAALEYAPTIRVNAVSPGMIRTPLTELLLDQRGIGLEDQQRAKTPLDRIGTPGDIADVVVFLCSDLARFVTGQNLVVDGGMTLHGSGVDGVLDVVRDLLSRR